MTIAAATQEAVGLYNDALAELGEKGVDSFAAETPVAQAAARRYQKIARFCIGLYPWSWQTGRVQLSQLASPPMSASDYVYDVPGGGKILAVYDEADASYPFHAYRVIGAQVHSDAEALWADVQSADVNFGILNWSPSFRMAMTKALAADVCMSVGGTRTQKADLTAEAHGILGSPDYPRGGLIAAAAGEDGQQDAGGVMRLDGGDLLAARHR